MAKQSKQSKGETSSLEKELQRLTRELEIEASLERVRARAMGMYSSEELAYLVADLFREMTALDFNLTSCIIWIHDPELNKDELWVASRELNKPAEPYYVKPFHPAFFKSIIQAWKEKDQKWAYKLKGKEKAAFQEAFFQEVTKLPDVLRAVLETSDKVVFSASFNRFGALEVVGKESMSGEKFDLLHRFGNVFNSTYTRFLDLQKAEAQTREAQIETALERVRSRSMAMHNSEELSDVIAVISEQLQQLKVKFANVAFVIDNKTSDDYWIALPGTTQPYRIHVPALNNPWFQRIGKARLEGLTFYQDTLTPEEIREIFSHIFNHNPTFLSPKTREFALSSGGWTRSIALLPNIILAMANLASMPYTEEDNQIIRRIAGVFEQSYQRFLDLQKAEAQAREAQIELALERIRARGMAMQKSDELRDIIQVVFEQFQELSFKIDAAYFNVDYKESDDLHAWIASTARTYPTRIDVPYFDNEFFKILKEGKEKELDLVTGVAAFEEKNRFWKHFFRHATVAPERQAYVLSAPGLATSNALMNHVTLCIANYQGVPFSEAENAVLRRFGTVFEQSYTRFLDLQKAEVQAHEAKIEAALERVRSRTMAMHKGDELAEVVGIIFKQLELLDFGLLQILVTIIDLEKNVIEWWSKGPQAVDLPQRSIIPIIDHPFLNAWMAEWKKGTEYSVYNLKGEVKRSWDEYLFTQTDLKHFPQEVKDLMRGIESAWLSDAFLKYGSMQAAGKSPLSDEQAQVLKRFAKALDLAYTRIIDLQKAEAQTREAHVEASLERVRSRMMAMHKSEELPEIMKAITEQFSHLGFRIDAVSFNPDKTTIANNLWIATPQKSFPVQTFIPYFDHPIFNLTREAVVNGLDSRAFNVSQEDTRKWWKYFLENSNVSHLSEKGKNLVLKISKMSVSQAFMKSSYLSIWNYSGIPFSGDENAILKRFANVFEQAYTRFLDIEKAEAQAREAIIEAALEKVRGKAMAMHNSNDLATTAGTVLSELKKLGISPLRFAVGLVDKKSRKSNSYSFLSSSDGDTLALVGSITLSGNPVLEKAYASWEAGEDYFPELYGDAYKSYYEAIAPALSLPPVQQAHLEQRQYGSFISIPVGYVVAWTQQPCNETEVRTIKRFASIIDLTFRRYMELQKSEANAHEVVKRSSLDRVRAEIASMRSTKDLERITPLIWSELTTLRVPFVRCGVFIMDEEHKLIHNYLSTPDGKSIAAIHVPYDTPGLFAQGLSHWREKKIFVSHLDKAVFAEIATSMVKHGAFASEGQYLSTLTHSDLYGHFLPFLQGMLYVANAVPLDEDQTKLVQSLADAFSTAYARYEDFNKLETAKVQIEKTLADLKQTQAQLVQSEKMASLGELTAGIAHEIQNPLNFVNNFAEVNKELLAEMNEEIEKGNFSEVKALAKDITDNQEKINHHGKRADGIVKGMLQHSRSSSSTKEPTDINKLADEYLRLAYHGLRAKDKSFNAKFETDFDMTIGKVNVIPQDIGRVILNLITNAFYAVTEKKSALAKASSSAEASADSTVGEEAKYEPTVMVSTRRAGSPLGVGGSAGRAGIIEISVADNGNGIPQKALDKIFQPFFTTKPTGKGTGLGLSISYDIVKTHGGELRVETKEGKGSEFVISLPIV